MIKKCKVTLHNSAVIVVDFDGKLIQMPSADVGEYAYVKFEKGRHSLTTEKEFERANTKPKKRVETELVEEIVADSENANE